MGKRNLLETHAPVQAGGIKDEISPEQQFISNWEERDSLTFSSDQGLHMPVSRSLTGAWLPVCARESVCVYVCVRETGCERLCHYSEAIGMWVTV